jgi:hypothetical protein
VQRDNQGGIAVAITLGVMAVLGVILFLVYDGPSLVSASPEGPAVFGVGVFVLGSVAVGTIVLVVRSKNRTTTALGGVFGGLFLGAGFVLLFVVLMCAAMINFLQTCLKPGR